MIERNNFAVDGFARAGRDNTVAAIAAMRHGIIATGVKQVVVASTHGDTGLLAAASLADTGTRLVVVTHNVGFGEAGRLEMTEEVRNRLTAGGARVLTGTMPFRNIGTAIRAKQGCSQQELIADTLRIFGQGLKVCVEIAMMAADCGMIVPGDVICVAGTGRGADTVALIAPTSSNRFFDLKIRRVLAKPLDW